MPTWLLSLLPGGYSRAMPNRHRERSEPAPDRAWQQLLSSAANRAELAMGTGGKRLSRALCQVRSGCRNQGCCLLPAEPTEQAVLWIHGGLKHIPKGENAPKGGNLFWQQKRVKFKVVDEGWKQLLAHRWSGGFNFLTVCSKFLFWMPGEGFGMSLGEVCSEGIFSRGSKPC